MVYKPTLPFNVQMKLLIPTWKNVDGERIEMTEEEIQQLEKEQAAFEDYEKTRPFTQQEVMSMLLSEQINTIQPDGLMIQEQYVPGVGMESIIHRTVCFIIAQRVQEIRYINRYLSLLESMWKLLRRVSALLFLCPGMA